MASALRSTFLRQASPLSAFARPSQRLARCSPLALAPRAAFQTSSRRQILPAGPQVIKGGVNDAAPVPPADPSHGNYHWTFERLISAGLVPITIAPFAAGSLSPLIDGTFIGLLIIHSYIGFQSCVTDYFPTWRVPFVRKLLEWANLIVAFIVGWGYYEFETNDIGLTAAIARIWKAGKE